MEERAFKYNYSSEALTGDSDYSISSKVVELKFEKYLVKIRVSPQNEILGIEEITINKDFLSQNQRLQALSRQGYHDVEKFYKDEEE